jgi:hypothetical protein
MSNTPKKPTMSELAASNLSKEYARAKAVTNSARDFAAEVLAMSTDFLAQNLTDRQYKIDYKRDADGRISVTPMAVQIDFADGHELEVSFDPAGKKVSVSRNGAELFESAMTKAGAQDALRAVVARELASEVDLMRKLKDEVNGPNTGTLSASARSGLTMPKPKG